LSIAKYQAAIPSKHLLDWQEKKEVKNNMNEFN